MRRDRTIATAYDLIPMREPAVMSRMRAHRRLAYRGYLRLIRGVRGVIAISRTTADDLGAILDVTDDRIRIVPPFVKQWVPPAVPDSSCQSGRPSFLFVGVPDPHKRPELAVDALSELVRRGMDATLDFAGVQPSRDRFRLRARAEANGLAKRIRFLDRIPDAELHARFAGSVLLALSTIEGFGLPPVEAVLAGGRVVATPTPAYVESLAGVATFSTGDSAEEVADAMEVALERKVPDDAREALARAHSAPTVAAALRRAYRQFGDF
jgi:glycosyltransferase involved in cell wall biosynthesis